MNKIIVITSYSIHYTKLYESGEVNVNDRLTNSRTGESEIINQLFIMDGKERQAVSKLSVGDIGATLKLKFTETNDTLFSGKDQISLKHIQYPEQRMVLAVSALTQNDEEKLSEALKKIHIQDPTVSLTYSKETKELLIGCQGELHLTT